MYQWERKVFCRLARVRRCIRGGEILYYYTCNLVLLFRNEVNIITGTRFCDQCQGIMYQTSGKFLWTRFNMHLLFLDRFPVIRHLQHEVCLNVIFYLTLVWCEHVIFFTSKQSIPCWVLLVLRYPYHFEVFLQIDLTKTSILRLPATWLFEGQCQCWILLIYMIIP